MKLGSCDPQIALILLRMCGGFTKLVHVARSTPPSLELDELHTFDEQVRCTFTECRAIDTTDSSWIPPPNLTGSLPVTLGRGVDEAVA